MEGLADRNSGCHFRRVCWGGIADFGPGTGSLGRNHRNAHFDTCFFYNHHTDEGSFAAGGYERDKRNVEGDDAGGGAELAGKRTR